MIHMTLNKQDKETWPERRRLELVVWGQRDLDNGKEQLCLHEWEAEVSGGEDFKA